MDLRDKFLCIIQAHRTLPPLAASIVMFVAETSDSGTSRDSRRAVALPRFIAWHGRCVTRARFFKAINRAKRAGYLDDDGNRHDGVRDLRLCFPEAPGVDLSADSSAEFERPRVDRKGDSESTARATLRTASLYTLPPIPTPIPNSASRSREDSAMAASDARDQPTLPGILVPVEKERREPGAAKKKPATPDGKKIGDLAAHRFDGYAKVCWDEFPDAKKGRKRNFAAFKKLLGEALRAGTPYKEILSGIRAYARYTQFHSAQYIKGPIPWMRDERWAWDYNTSESA
jgi:hypothetical protein